ncbi:NADP-dependent 3-hydroxy acid dehydrogenase YdfG [Roseibium hamelinense]|uniref:NADP-dependent 3-hydroxy acid dehydrogenase YdfG n=1 Tax=Roseibium hamelinense TaxID=150831 RepID=A0A562T243_9HYPH|nr:SDR family oxidoreductase [Roseibium hamelinense]MTI42077.1 SDR family oxidoreductase [Roseibium hamelinense]TWI87154.1 NADP-dependent 3-hydroxy acid dehydrogenase YdfG [Roseibium hamelinense]
MSDHSGKVALVTGASRGIGEAGARSLARNGAAVVLAARSTTDIERIAQSIVESGGRAEAISCDVARFEDLEAAAALCLSRFDGLDILVNNAGLIDPISRIEDSSPDDWSKVIDVNVKGVYFGLRAVASHMLSQRSGKIINISSGAATGALEGWSHYCASKAAALSLTKCADKEWREHGIHVVGLSPGTVDTEMQVQIKASGINPVSRLDPSAHIPAQWVGEAISWLAGDASSHFLGADCSLRDETVRKAIGLV